MIIGITGKARSGKDTFAEYLTKCFKEKYQRYFKHAAFAAQLKSMCQEHFELSDEQLWGDKKEEWTKFVRKPKINLDGYKGSVLEPLEDYWTPREIMQELGGFYRKIDRDFWVTALDKYLENMKIEDAIITDVRHVNECEYVKINKGVLIKVVRPGAGEIHGMQHESETALDTMPNDYFDIEINNVGTLKDLYNAAEEASDAINMVENMMNKGRIVKDGQE